MVAAGYRSVLRQAVFALFGALMAFQLGMAGEVTRPPTTEIVTEVQKVLAEAEVLGLPSLTGATLFEGQLSLPNLTRWELSNASQYRHVHARLPDGSWLIDLIVPMPAARCRRAQLAALKPFVPGSPPEQRQRSGRRLSLENLQLLAAARRCAIGIPEAADFSLAQFDVGYSDFYPRVDKAQNVGDFVRLACRDHFLDLEQGEAAVAIAPEQWRAATRRLANRAPLPDPLAIGPVGLVASYLKPERGEEPDVDAPLLPAVDDATLVTLVGDRSPAAACGTVGETALYLLSQRWGIDAAILAGRDVASPLDDAEQDAIAAGLTAWWLRTKSQSMQQRWLEALQQVPVSSALMSLSNRKSIMDSRRSTVKDRLLYHTWSGDKAPEMPADDDAMIMEKYVQSLLTRWEKTTTIPADLDAKTWQTLMFQVDGSVGSSKLTAQEIRHRLDNERALAQRLDAIVMKWPRSGPLADSLLLWDDAHGRPDRLDARVEAALTKPDLNQDEAQAALLLWMQRETPERYRRIEELLARDPHDVAWQALFLLTVSSEETNTIFGMLAWSLLRDERPLPAEILSKELPHDEQRIALIVAKHWAAKYLATKYEIERVLMKPKMNGDEEVSLAALTRADATHSEQDAAITTLRSLYATQVAMLYTTRALPIPADCIVPETPPAQPIEVLPVTSPDLTAEEAAEIRAVLAKAVSLGFPDLTGAKAVARDFPIGTNDWSGVHLRLADGSWLAESVHVVPATKLDTEPDWLKPMPGTHLNHTDQLPPAARARVLGDLAVGQLADIHGDSVLPALAWWLSGTDATGQTVVATVLNEAVLGHDVADIWSIATGRGGKDRGNVETVPTIADGVRRSAARWFRHQVVWAKDGAAADQAIAAAKQILPPADLPVWESMLNILRARLDIPEKEPAGADLAARLQSWKSTDKNAQGNWVRSSRKVPAKRADTAALVALLDDQRSTRWVTDYALPRPLGDVALEALGDLWGFDWRWLVVTDPAVAAILPPQRAQQRHQIDRGDEWLWASTNWTTERRAVIMPAIKAWWQARAPNAPSPLHDVFKTLPLPLWDDVFRYLSATEAGAAALGDILVERLRTMAPPKLEAGMEQYTLGVVMKLAVRQPRHAGLTALLASWPQQPWMEAVTALRAEYAGDPATFDRWMQESLELPPPVDDDDRDPATPWALVGIWAHHPTPLRLAALRRILTSDLNDSRLPWLVSKLGLYDWLGNWSLLPSGHKELTQAAAQAVPCALALDGLKDQRAPKPSARRALIHSVNSYYRNQIAKRLPADARICDWVAVQTIGEDGVLSDNKQGLIEVEAFLTAPRAQRDAAIATIIERLTLRCEERLHAAGMVPTPAPVPTGADNF